MQPEGRLPRALARCVLALCVLATSSMLAAQRFTNYESPQTHPLALTAGGRRLLAVNTAAGSLSVLSLRDADAPLLLWEIPVGLEPVSVAAHTEDEVWVVNRLGDSISIVSLRQQTVVHTLQVGDEPADVVFAGDSPRRAFVSVGGTREVLVFDASRRRLSQRIPVAGIDPRALAVSADESTVWVAVHRSGNGTTLVPRGIAPPQPPPWDSKLPAGPKVPKIVHGDDPTWQGKLGAPVGDHDVMAIDVQRLRVVRTFDAVGTILFGLAVRPGHDEVWVANTEARNLVSFEPVLRGHVVDNRVTRIRTAGNGGGNAPALQPIDLNPHVDYRKLPNAHALATALAQPTDVAFDPRGERLYVAAFGTDRIGVVDPASGAVVHRIELGTGQPGTAAPRRKRGPRALVHHPRLDRLYVLNRLSNTISVVAPTRPSSAPGGRVLHEVPVGIDATPPALREARGFLYDAKLSGNGTMSCASCHVDGDTDGLAWDLGDPAGRHYVENKGNITFEVHPMKGPMTTQTLAGLAGVDPFHWRGDRASLHEFNQSFRTLLGGSELSTADIDDFARFMAGIDFPPNPNQNLDRTYPSEPKGQSAHDGSVYFQTADFGGTVDEKRCIDCHELPTGASSRIHGGRNSIQYIKIPHLRNVYKRLGRRSVGGERLSGFGLLHAGDRDDVPAVLSDPIFGSLTTQPETLRMLERFVLAFDTGTAPCVGYSVTATPSTVAHPQTRAAVGLLLQQATAGYADVVVRGSVAGRPRAFTYAAGTSTFTPDTAHEPPFDRAALEALLVAGDGTLTFLGVPPQAGARLGIDRDENGVRDADERGRAYGPSTAGCDGPLQLRVNSPPRVGNTTFAVVCTGATPGVDGMLLIGPPAAIPLLGLTFLVDPALGVVTRIGTERGDVAAAWLPIPAERSLSGRSFCVQAAFASACAPRGIATSHGLAVTIGQ